MTEPYLPKATGAAADAVYDWLLQSVIKPHAWELTEIISSPERVAALVWQPSAEAQEAARVFGWKGVDGVFTISKGLRRRIAAEADHEFSTWLRSRRSGRFILLVEAALFAVEFDSEDGTYSVLGEPKLN